jgi:hypothetical protein
LCGGLRATGHAVTSEGKAIVGELDAPAITAPGFWRCAWRYFRRLPGVVQILAAVCLFALWAGILFFLFSGNPPPTKQSAPSQPGLVCACVHYPRVAAEADASG